MAAQRAGGHAATRAAPVSPEDSRPAKSTFRRHLGSSPDRPSLPHLAPDRWGNSGAERAHL
eukprot:3686079-Alexandrium_andersonii.AAC.1